MWKPKVTKNSNQPKYVHGATDGKYIYFNGNPITLFHELFHFYAMNIKEHIGRMSPILFLDLLEGIWDFVNGILRYKFWRQEIHPVIYAYIKEPLNTWLDWVLCRPIEGI